MKKLRSIILGGVLILTSCLSLAAPLDRIAAIVNDDVITQSEYQKALHLAEMQFKQSALTAHMKKQLLEQLIDKKLQLQIAKQAGITVGTKEIDHLVQNLAKQNHVSVSDFYQRINQEGLSTSEYRHVLQEQLTIQRFQQQQISKVRITPEEIAAYLRNYRQQNTVANAEKEYSVIDILIPLTDNPSLQEMVAAKENANALIDQLKNGKDIEQALKNVSAEAADLGWRKLSDLPSAFVRTVAGMKVDDLSAPIETGNGYHVLKLVEIRVNNSQAATLTRQQAEQALTQEKIEAQVKQLVSKLRSQSYIEIQAV